MLEQRPGDAEALSGDLKRVLEIGDSAVAHQFQVSERLDAKARGQVTIAATWFAVTQAVAGVAYAAQPGNLWLALLLAATFWGGVALAVTFYFSYLVWKPRKERELTHSGFRKLANDALSGDPALTDEIVTFYQHIIGHRRKSNGERVEQLKRAQVAWSFAMAFTFAELIIALLTRVLD
jgi:hypothetical protein